VHLSIFISVINQLDAQNFCFTVSLFQAYTCFEHMSFTEKTSFAILLCNLEFHENLWIYIHSSHIPSDLSEIRYKIFEHSLSKGKAKIFLRVQMKLRLGLCCERLWYLISTEFLGKACTLRHGIGNLQSSSFH